MGKGLQSICNRPVQLIKVDRCESKIRSWDRDVLWAVMTIETVDNLLKGPKSQLSRRYTKNIPDIILCGNLIASKQLGVE